MAQNTNKRKRIIFYLTVIIEMLAGFIMYLLALLARASDGEAIIVMILFFIFIEVNELNKRLSKKWDSNDIECKEGN